MLKNKKLSLVCGTLTSGGGERIISVLSSQFLSYFQEVEIILWREAPVFYQIDKRIKIITIPSEIKSKKILKQIFWFRQYVKSTRPYCVVSFLTAFNILTLVSLRGVHVPVLISNRSDPYYDAPNWIWRKIRDFTYLFADGITVQTQSNKKYFFEFLQKKVRVINNPVFIEPEMVGKALYVKKDKLIVSVGRLDRAKNQNLLLEVFAKIRQLYPEYHLIIYGEGEMRTVLENKIKELHLEECVFLAGAQKNVHHLMLNAELFVLSSDFEGMPNALIEAMCLGIPCISTRVSGATDLISDRLNGILVNIRDGEQLKEAIIELIDDKPKAIHLANEGIKLAEKLKLESIVEQWVQCIKDVVAAK